LKIHPPGQVGPVAAASASPGMSRVIDHAQGDLGTRAGDSRVTSPTANAVAGHFSASK